MSESKEKVDERLEEEIVDEVAESIEEAIEEVMEEEEEMTILKNRIEELEQANKELDNKYYMAYADAQNISKRAKIDAENMLINKVSALMEDILPVLDNFERALNTETDDKSILNFLKGFEIVYHQLRTALVNEGIEEIESVGVEFNPNYHQSIGVVNDKNYDSNIVVEELQKGYIFRNRVIRPAMVKINE